MKPKLTLIAAALAASVAFAAAPAAQARHWHGHHGGGIGAGIAGFAAGALIGGAVAAGSGPYYYRGGPYYGGYGYDYAPDVVEVPAGGGAEAYCEQRYRSYNPSTGTYLGYDGRHHPCP